MIPNHSSLKLVTAATVEPVSLDLAKSHLRVSNTSDDTLIGQYIRNAREYCEWETGRAFATQTWRFSMDRFPLLPNSQYSPGNANIVQPAVNNLWPLDPSAWAIMLPRSPLLEVTSLQYLDINGDLQTMDPSLYTVDADSEPARLTTPAGSFWPSTVFDTQAVQVTFSAGYGDGLVPNVVIQAILMLVSHWYEHREAVWDGPGGTPAQVPLAVPALLSKVAVMWIW